MQSKIVHLSAEEWRSLNGVGKKVPIRALDAKAKAAPKPDRHKMNKNEAAYERHLNAARLQGAIHDYTWSPCKLRLGSDYKTTLTVDFVVVHNDMTLEFVDVKGRKGTKFWAEEDAMVKLKCAAEQYPWFAFVIVWQQKDGTWSRHPL